MKIMDMYKKTATLIFLMVAILAPVQEVWGQAVKGDKYESSYRSGRNTVTTYDKKIQHKAAKWYTMRSGSNFVDTFDDEHPMFTNAGDDIQSAHTYVDTLYVKKGSSVSLWLPTISSSQNQNSARYYQRWYNYLTEGTFATGLTRNQQVNDILTPKSETTVYRFQNGYVGGNEVIGTSSIMYGADFYYPKDNEYTEYTNTGLKNGSAGNDYYIVACDVSGYTDFTTSGNGDNRTFTEPTLGLRVLYYIVGIDESWVENKTYENQYERLNTGDYKNNGDKYLEEYEITFPCDHIGNFTNELVSIARQAQFYRIPGDDNDDKLTARLEGTTIFKLVDNGGQDTNTANDDGTLTLGDNSRAIFFRKNEGENKDPWSVLDGTTATILVTKTVGSTTYNIARFKLTFKKEIRLLTQHQIARLDEARANNTTITGEGGWFDESYLYRTPAYLDENYILLTSRTFDYDSNVTDAGETTAHQGEYYPYPLAWDFSSYAFYDGTKEGHGFDGSTDGNTSFGDAFTEWGSYAIVNDYMGYGDKTESPKTPTNPGLGGRNSSGYFLYVDASNLPGKLVTLPFSQNLCAGSELLVSAWVKSAGANNTSTDDAAMLFSIYGIDDKNNRTLIHAQTTGQIRRTTNIQSGTGEYTQANGYGSQENDWYQVVLSFLNDDPNVANFKSYEVQIDNNSGSTSGGDFYLDEIKVYISKPLAEVTQLETACSTERTLLSLSLDRERLLARVGSGSLMDGEDSKKYGQIGVVLVDTLLFRNNFKGDYKEAILASAVDLGISEEESYHSRVLNFYGNFDYHKVYNEDGINLASANDHFFYRNGTAAEDNSSLITDFYGDLTPGRTYWLLLYPYPEVEKIEVSDGTEAGKKEILIIDDDRLGEYFAYFDTDRCAIKADFKVTGDVIIKVDGEIVTPKTEFCRGNINNFTVELQIPDLSTTNPDDTITITEGIYFDWFFGEARDGKIADPMTQYTEKVSMATGTPVAAADGISLQEALVAFRNLYPGATALSTTDTPVSDDDFTQEMYDLINYYLNLDPPVGAQNRPLVLHQPSLNITLLESLRVVVQPIPMSIGMDNLPAGYDETEWLSLCWGYTYLELTTTNAAPTVYPGFNTVAYPTDLTGQSLRIGLDQITSVKSGNSNKNTLTVDLRDAKSYKTTDPSNPNKDFTLQLIGGDINPDPDYNKLFLTDTDDPAMKVFIDKQGTSFDNHSLPIGVVKSFEAHYYGEGTTEKINKMEVQFILDPQEVLINGQNEPFTFAPREGYYYTFNVYFEEFEAGGATACYGRFPLTMKVVPEYLVWNDTQKTDDILGNWNYDGNWLRATNRDIKATNTINEYGNDNRAFVPMLFSKVVIPTNSKIQLYQAGYGENGKWNNEDRPAEVADPTQNIQYDLMAFESGSPLKTERYRVSLLNQIHFEPGAEMLHAEYLLYDTAWVDYQLDKGRWYTLASPLKAVYAGDFYTDISGTEGNEYFQPIYYSEEYNSRFNPSVYQRGWKESNATMVGTPGGERAIAGNWSALYNKVDEAYTPGTGFSLKVQDIADNSSAIFRLPKADGSYKYYPHGDGQSDNETTVSRVEVEGGEKVSGRLQSDQLFIRNTDIDKADEGAPIEITLSETAGGNYYLVGNPFMAHLDMEKFFEEQTFNDITINNGEVLEWKYWYLDDDGTQVAVSYNEENDVWTSTKTTGDDFLIPPLRSFFVERKEGDDNVIKFTQNMQVLGGTDDGVRSANALTITATTSDGRTSRAAVAYDMAASADYEASEDAELFLDSNLGDVPMVYTVAGTMATSINRTSELYNIPLGVYGNKQEMVTLSFGGLNQFSSATLYDAQEQTETPLREGKTVSVPAGTSGRYFLRAGTPTGNEVIARNAFLVYSVGGGKVMVTSSNTPLKDIRVYTMGGAQVRSIQASGMQQEIYLNRGIYLITVSDQDGLQETKKVLVR